MWCVSVGSLCDCHDQIYDLPFGTLVLSSPMHPGNPGTNTCLENEKPPKTPIGIRDFSGKCPIFSMVLHVETKKSSHNHPHPFSVGTLVDHSWVVWEGPHSHTAGGIYPATSRRGAYHGENQIFLDIGVLIYMIMILKSSKYEYMRTYLIFLKVVFYG